jgi:hypothetical protein
MPRISSQHSQGPEKDTSSLRSGGGGGGGGVAKPSNNRSTTNGPTDVKTEVIDNH